MIQHAAGAKRGFTLMELLLVISLLAVVTSLFVSGVLRWGQKQKLSEAATVLRTEIGRSRAFAIEQGEVWVLKADADGLIVSGPEGASAESEISPFTLPSGVQMRMIGQSGEEAESIRMFPDGTISEVTIALKDSNNTETILVADRLTGMVQVVNSSQ